MCRSGFSFFFTHSILAQYKSVIRNVVIIYLKYIICKIITFFVIFALSLNQLIVAKYAQL